MKKIKKAIIKDKIIVELEQIEENYIEVLDKVSFENATDVEIDLNILKEHVERKIRKFHFYEIYKGIEFYKRYKDALKGIKINLDEIEKHNFSFGYSVLILKVFKDLELLDENGLERIRKLVEKSLDYGYDFHNKFKELLSYGERDLAIKLMKKVILYFCNKPFFENEINETFTNALRNGIESTDFLDALHVVEIIYSNNLESLFEKEIEMLREKIYKALRGYNYGLILSLKSMLTSEYYKRFGMIILKILNDESLKRKLIEYLI